VLRIRTIAVVAIVVLALVAFFGITFLVTRLGPCNQNDGKLAFCMNGQKLLAWIGIRPEQCGAEYYQHQWAEVEFKKHPWPVGVSLTYCRYTPTHGSAPDTLDLFALSVGYGSAYQCHDVFMRHIFVFVPMWVIVLSVGTLLWLVAWPIRNRIRRSHRRRRGLCVQCGYNLAKNTSGVCPECGTQFERLAVASPQRGDGV
jgi:hypothetical protein